MGGEPRAPRTLSAFYHRVAPTTAAMFHAHSHMREVDDDAALDPYVLAAMEMPDGILGLRPAMARRLRRLIEGPPVATPGLQRQLVTDLLTILHESLHACGPEDRRRMRAAAVDVSATDGTGAFDEGFVEWAAQRSLPAFIRALGLDSRNPWLLTNPAKGAYEPLPVAMGSLVVHVASLRGVSALAESRRLIQAGVPKFALETLARDWVAAGRTSASRADAPHVRDSILRMAQTITATGGYDADGVRAANRLIRSIDRQLGIGSPVADVRAVA